MSTKVNLYSVMFSGPSDVDEEREAFLSAISSCNRLFRSAEANAQLVPLHWSSDVVPGSSDSPQAIINKQLVAAADALVATFHSRLGTPTDTHASGSVEEIELATASGIPRIICFFEGPRDDFDPEQFKNLMDYRKTLQAGLFTASYRAPAELQAQLTEWLFDTFVRRTLPSRGMVPAQARRMVKMDSLLSGAAHGLEPVLTGIAGSRDRALLAILEHATLDEFIASYGWTLKVRSEEEIKELEKPRPRRCTYALMYIGGPEEDDSSYGVLFIRKKDRLVEANHKWFESYPPYYDELRRVTA
jgi:hypothetical protein